MSSRRQALQIAGTTLTLSWLSGCLGILTNGGIRNRIENRDDQQHTVSVAFARADETVFSDQYTVSAGEEITTDDVVAAGEYRVTVELDSAGTKTIEFDMNGCDSNTLFVPIYESGEFEPTVYTQC